LSQKDQSRGRPVATTTAERIAVIIEAAERAAESVIDDAEEQAARHVEEARAQANRIAADRLRELADSLDPGGRQPPGPVHLKPVEAPPPQEEADAAEEEGAGGRPRRRSNLAGARLLATQMAVSGSSREDIAGRLRTEFGIEDSTAILDAILGPEKD
jgi:cell division septum initiation protein DivIVA